MTLNRRNVLKTLLMSPFFGAARKLGPIHFLGPLQRAQ
jgi:hypothetical protein